MNQLRKKINSLSQSKTCLVLHKFKVPLQTLLIPLLASPLPIAINTKEAHCAFILIIVIGYWITECIPVGIASLIPVVLYPIFQIASSKCTAQIYFSVY
jgi:sodium-dependent dicarboxylate transporter 2/3/5